MNPRPFRNHMEVTYDFHARHYNYQFSREVALGRQGYLATELRSIVTVTNVIIASSSLFRIRHDDDSSTHFAIIHAIGRHAKLSEADINAMGVRIFPLRDFVSFETFRRRAVTRQ